MPILKEKFQPILMKVDTPTINRYLKELESSVKYCNQLIEDVAQLLRFDLTDEQKIQVVKEDKRAVLDIIKTHYDLEGSNDQMALNRTSVTNNQLNKIFGEYHSFDKTSIEELDIVKGSFVVRETSIEKIQKKYTYTTETESQNRTYHVLKQLGESIQLAIDEGFIVVSKSDYSKFKGERTRLSLSGKYLYVGAKEIKTIEVKKNMQTDYHTYPLI